METDNTDKRLLEREIIIARLEILSPDLCLSSGNEDSASISRDEMIQHVQSGDDIGNEFVKIEMRFLRAFKDGTIYSKIEALAA